MKPASRIETAFKQKFHQKKGIVLFGAALGIAGVVFIDSVIQGLIVYLPWNVAVAAHKGDNIHAPENSILAVKSTIANGVEIVEIDVTLTKDNVLVLSHDQDLKRMAGIPDNISDLTYEEIKRVDFGSSFDEAYAGETIPTLDEILKLTTEADTGILIDVKTNENEGIYAKRIESLIEKYEAEDLALVQSFNHYFLNSMRQ